MKKLLTLFIAAFFLLLSPGGYLVRSHAAGASEFFKNQYQIRYLFAFDQTAGWTEVEKKNAAAQLSRACAFIEEESKNYGCPITFQLSSAPSYHSPSPISRNGSDFVVLLSQVIQQLGRPKQSTFYVVLVNKSGPSYACPSSSQCVIYYKTFLSEEAEGSATYAHELLHLLGALDFSSFGASVYSALQEHFPGDIMLDISEDSHVSLFTAELLGWI